MEKFWLFACLLGTTLSIVIMLVFYFKGRPQNKNEPDQQLFLLLQNQINELGRNIEQKLATANKNIDDTKNHIHSTIQTQFGQSAKIITEVTERLTKLDETNRQVVGFAEQLQNLENILQNPKQRGILGEYYLENVLKNVLPPNNYQMQHKFKDGTIVDAVVFVGERIIPVDSKFSLENYNRAIAEKDTDKKTELETVFRSDLKKRIDETSKYIKPEEGTMDFAFMFIPAEGIYYDLLINKVGSLKTNTQALIEYAFKEKRVIIVSPTSFLAYLQTVMQGLRALKIEESAKDIRARVEELGRHLLAYDEYVKKLGNNLNTTVNSYNLAYKELGKIDKDVVKITGHERQIEPTFIDKTATFND